MELNETNETMETITPNNEVNEALVKYHELNRKAKEIETEMKKLRPVIMDYITNKLGGCPLEYGGLRAVLANGTKKTLVAESVERYFDIQLPDECYKMLNYPILKVSRID